MKKISKVVLVNPVYKRKGYYNKFHGGYQPLALGVIAALTPLPIEVILIDERFEEFEKKIYEIQGVDLIGITGLTTSITRGYEIAQRAKQLNIPVIMGGIHVSFNPDEALQFCDSVVIGEAEGLWQKALHDFEGGNLERRYEREKDSADVIPVAPRRDIFKYDYFVGGIQTARGCPMDCDFCSVTEYNGGKYRKREVEEVIKELKEIKQKEIFFYDDNIVGRTAEQKECAVKMFNRMIEEKTDKLWTCQASTNIGEDEELLRLMYRAGCRAMLVGFESLNKDNLKAMRKATNLNAISKYNDYIKRIHDSGIAILGAFIIGYPNDNIETTNILSDFILDNKIDIFIISYLTPLPGTKLFKKLNDEKRIIGSNDMEHWKKYDFVNVVFKHEKLSKEELEEIMYKIREKIMVPFSAMIKRFFNTLFETRSLSTALIALRLNYFYRAQYLSRLKFMEKSPD
jgi:radical SAM superfamily enzyme YgiQ (UPF0313 family)